LFILSEIQISRKKEILVLKPVLSLSAEHVQIPQVKYILTFYAGAPDELDV